MILIKLLLMFLGWVLTVVVFFQLLALLSLPLLISLDYLDSRYQLNMLPQVLLCLSLLLMSMLLVVGWSALRPHLSWDEVLMMLILVPLNSYLLSLFS